MALLNYTTKIPASQTVGEIMTILTRIGAERVSVTYGKSGTPIGLEFAVMTQHGERAFALPSRIDAALVKLTERHARVRNRTHAARPTYAHAANVAWRIVKDWTEAQAALIELGLVRTEEVLLPYMLTSSGQTVFALVEQRQLALPSPQEG